MLIASWKITLIFTAIVICQIYTTSKNVKTNQSQAKNNSKINIVLKTEKDKNPLVVLILMNTIKVY
jgi:hypothetical protein